VSLSGPRGSINNYGIFTVQAARFGPDNHPAEVPPMIVIAREHYDRLARLVEHGIHTTVELDSSTHFSSQTRDAFNLIGEIRGNTKPEEVVMIGAHLDSWAGGTGATDNAAGCAIIIEAFRLLQNLGPKMDRTLRLALWGGEEMGLRGSSIYVKQHFPASQPEPGHGRIVAYFNLDGGTGKIRGIEGTVPSRTVLSQLLAPLRDLGVAVVSPRITRGSDHASFADASLPAYAFIQDPLDYSTRTHHTNMDVYDRLQPEDLKQAVAVVATVLYEASNREQVLPQKQAEEGQLKR
jgi:Zn-dependent M28 family amino/carboxypeptidase